MLNLADIITISFCLGLNSIHSIFACVHKRDILYSVCKLQEDKNILLFTTFTKSVLARVLQHALVVESHVRIVLISIVRYCKSLTTQAYAHCKGS